MFSSKTHKFDMLLLRDCLPKMHGGTQDCNCKFFCVSVRRLFYFMHFFLIRELEQDSTEINAVYFKNHVMQSLNILFGEVGASISIDVLKYDQVSRRAVLRCPSASYVKLLSSLSLCGEYSNICCAYRIHNTSPCLLSLLGTSRGYNHC